MQGYRLTSFLMYIIAALLIVLFTAGCTYDVPVENTTPVPTMTGTELNDTQQNITSPQEERFVPENVLRIGERFRYNDITGTHDPSGVGDTISIWIDGTTLSKSYFLKPRYLGAELINCPADEEEKYLFVRIKSVALKNSAYTPYIDAFSLVVDDGRIYSPSLCFCDEALCLAGGEAGFYGNVEVANLYTIQDIGGIYTSSLIDRSEVQALIMFTVPDSFSKSASYVVLDTGGDEAAWSLSDVYVDATVKKGDQRIYFSVQNAANLHLVRDITVSLTYTDGSIFEVNAAIPGIGETATIEVPSVSEKMDIKANLYSGEKVLIYTEK